MYSSSVDTVWNLKTFTRKELYKIPSWKFVMDLRACQLIRQYFLPDPRANIPRPGILRSLRELSAPFLRLSTRLLSSFSFVYRPSRSRLLPLALESFAAVSSVQPRSSHPYERMIASLIGGLATRKRYGNTISTRERSALINTLRVLGSRQVARSLSWRFLNLRLVTENKRWV